MYRIGFDAKRLFNNFTGLGNYSRTLVNNLSTYYPDNEYFLYSPKVKENEETHVFLNSAMYNVQQPNRVNGPFWRSRGMITDLKRQQIQLYHGLSHEIPFGIGKKGIPSVVSIHDLIFKHYPDQYAWLDRQIYDLKFKYASQNADIVIAISESTKKDIVDFYNVSPDKIRVLYQSCHERFMIEKAPNALEAIRTKYKLPKEFLLYVGSLIERKNLLGIVAAYAALPASLRLPLIVIGKGEAYKKRVLALAKKLGVLDRLVFLDPAFEDFPAIYQLANIFLYPSYFEGFGIPVLEALFSKTPVITSTISSLPEAAGQGALLVDPAQSEAMAEAIEQLLCNDDMRKDLIAKGYEHANTFKGEALSKQLMGIYQELLA